MEQFWEEEGLRGRRNPRLTTTAMLPLPDRQRFTAASKSAEILRPPLESMFELAASLGLIQTHLTGNTPLLLCCLVLTLGNAIHRHYASLWWELAEFPPWFFLYFVVTEFSGFIMNSRWTNTNFWEILLRYLLQPTLLTHTLFCCQTWPLPSRHGLQHTPESALWFLTP